MRFRGYLRGTTLLLGLALGAGASGLAQQQQPEDISITKECNSAQFDEILARVDQTLANFNFQCNPKKLLKEANNLVILASLYNRAKYRIVAGDKNKATGKLENGILTNASPSATISSLGASEKVVLEDNTCLSKKNIVAKAGGGVQPGSGDDETVKSCVDRLLRIATDSELSSREIVLQNNKLIRDMTSSDDKLEAGSIASADTKKGIVTDFYRAGESDKGFTKFTAGNLPEKGSTKNLGSETLKAVNEGVAKAETKDLTEINANIQTGKDKDPRVEVAVVDDANKVVTTTALTAGMKPVSGKIKDAFQHDQLDIESAIDAERTKRIAAAKLKPSLNPQTVSFRAFQSIKQAIDGGINQIKKNTANGATSAPSVPGKSLSDAELEGKSVNIPISDKAMGRDKGSDPVDKQIGEDINDLKNSL